MARECWEKWWAWRQKVTPVLPPQLCWNVGPAHCSLAQTPMRCEQVKGLTIRASGMIRFNTQVFISSLIGTKFHQCHNLPRIKHLCDEEIWSPQVAQWSGPIVRMWAYFGYPKFKTVIPHAAVQVWPDVNAHPLAKCGCAEVGFSDRGSFKGGCFV